MNERKRMSGFVLLAFIAPALPVGQLGGAALSWWQSIPALVVLAVLTLSLIAARQGKRAPLVEAALLVPGVAAGAWLPFALMAAGTDLGEAPAIWVFLLGVLAVLWHLLELLTQSEMRSVRLLVPTLFGLMLLYLWQLVVQGFSIPSVLLPTPSAIGDAMAAQRPDLIDDFFQTVMKSVLRGYVIGCGLGFVVAILADRIPFLARGLLPYGNLVSAIPIVGIAPIMVMWFGFGWESKAAVVVISTFFPMLVNTLAGLTASQAIELDLMRSYAAGYWKTLFLVRLPNALPFLFNGLKINSTLALIGAIVAEFFGTPVVGMGFRISTEVARMNLAIVWATIVVAGLTGSALYGGLSLLERSVTTWHPSNRRR